MARRKVKWSETAVQQRRLILSFWKRKNHSPEYSKKLIRQIKKRTDLIALHPYLFPKANYFNTRVCVMGNFSIYYTVEKYSIFIISFWDNRDDPDKLNSLLKIMK